MLLWLQKNLILAIVMGVMATTIIGLSTFTLHQSKKIGSLESDNKTIKTERDQSRQDMASLELAYAALESAHKKCMSEISVSKAAGEAAVERITIFETQLRQASSELRINRDKIYLEASCNALATLDINALCPALAGSLRSRAASQAQPSP